MNANDKLVFNYIRKFGPDGRTPPYSKRQALNFLHNYPYGTPEYDRLLFWAKGHKVRKPNPQPAVSKAPETLGTQEKEHQEHVPLKNSPNKPLVKTGSISRPKKRSGTKKLASFHKSP